MGNLTIVQVWCLVHELNRPLLSPLLEVSPLRCTTLTKLIMHKIKCQPISYSTKGTTTFKVYMTYPLDYTQGSQVILRQLIGKHGIGKMLERKLFHAIGLR